MRSEDTPAATSASRIMSASLRACEAGSTMPPDTTTRGRPSRGNNRAPSVTFAAVSRFISSTNVPPWRCVVTPLPITTTASTDGASAALRIELTPILRPCCRAECTGNVLRSAYSTTVPVRSARPARGNGRGAQIRPSPTSRTMTRHEAVPGTNSLAISSTGITTSGDRSNDTRPDERGQCHRQPLPQGYRLLEPGIAGTLIRQCVAAEERVLPVHRRRNGSPLPFELVGALPHRGAAEIERPATGFDRVFDHGPVEKVVRAGRTVASERGRPRNFERIAIPD